MKSISVVHPTRMRPKKAAETAEKWIKSASYPAMLEWVFVVDADDTTRQELESEVQGLVDRLSSDVYKRYTVNIKIVLNTTRYDVVTATNVGASKTQGSILVYVSDDFDCPDGWDASIVKEAITAKTELGDKFLIKVADGLQHPQCRLVTIPILSRPLYAHLGYFFHPEYKSMFVDNDLFEVCIKRGWIHDATKLVFQHNHWCNHKVEKDETYARTEKHYHTGAALFNARKNLGFQIN